MEPDLDELDRPSYPDDADVVVSMRIVEGKDYFAYRVLSDQARKKFHANWGPTDSPLWQGDVFVTPIRLACGTLNTAAYIPLWAFGLNAYTSDGLPWLPPIDANRR